MPDGFDVTDVLKKLKDNFQKPNEQPPAWSIWGDKPNQAAQQPRPGEQLPPGFPQAPRFDQPQVPVARPEQALPGPPLRPEQQLGTGRADEKTQQMVFQTVDQAKNQSYRSQSAKLFTQAIEAANQSRDPALQALSKVEYGLAHMSWGYSQEGFKWILEAGSNNPSIYDPNNNQTFLKRLSQVGMPQSAVELLLRKGVEDPTWYTKDAEATKKLDAAMFGPAFVAPQGGADGPQRRPGADPFMPPTGKPDQVNPNLDPPLPGQAGGWMKEQITVALRNARQDRDFNSAFNTYKQAVDMADRSRDPVMQATTRVETALALMSVGKTENGFAWLLDAGSKNPGLYDSRVNKGYIDRLSSAGMPKPIIDVIMANGARDPHWHLVDKQAAKNLDAMLRPAPAPPKQEVAPPVPYQPLQPVQPFLPPLEPKAPAPNPEPRKRPSPFG